MVFSSMLSIKGDKLPSAVRQPAYPRGDEHFYSTGLFGPYAEARIRIYCALLYGSYAKAIFLSRCRG
jgi:hypothetical protein